MQDHDGLRLGGQLGEREGWRPLRIEGSLERSATSIVIDPRAPKRQALRHAHARGPHLLLTQVRFETHRGVAWPDLEAEVPALASQETK